PPALFAVNGRSARTDEASVGVAVLVRRGHHVAQPSPWRRTGPSRGRGLNAPRRRRHRLAGAYWRYSGGRSGQRGLGNARNYPGRDIVVGDVDGNIQDVRLAAAESFRPAQADVEEFFSFDHLRKGLAAQSRFDDAVDVRRANSPAGTFFPIDPEFEIRLA